MNFVAVDTFLFLPIFRKLTVEVQMKKLFLMLLIILGTTTHAQIGINRPNYVQCADGGTRTVQIIGVNSSTCERMAVAYCTGGSMGTSQIHYFSAGLASGCLPQR